MKTRLEVVNNMKTRFDLFLVAKAFLFGNYIESSKQQPDNKVQSIWVVRAGGFLATSKYIVATKAFFI